MDQRRSLLPILTGNADPARHHDYVRTEYYDALNMYLPQEPGRHTPCWATMYRDERHKLVSYHGLDYGELYDLEHDPLELTNLWEAPAAAALRASLTQNSFDATVAACDPGPRPNRPFLSLDSTSTLERPALASLIAASR